MGMLYTSLTRLNEQAPRSDEQESSYVDSTYPSLLEYEFLLEEWRVSLFAQQLKTRFPISAKRLDKAWRKLGLEKLSAD